MKRAAALGLVLKETEPEQRTAELAAAIMADGQTDLFGDFDREQAEARRRRLEVARAPLFQDELF